LFLISSLARWVLMDEVAWFGTGLGDWRDKADPPKTCVLRLVVHSLSVVGPYRA
jgi:hypothetical protein